MIPPSRCALVVAGRTAPALAAVSAAKWVGSTAYAIADKALQPLYMGYDLLQCGYVGVVGAVTGEYWEPNWVSDLAKNVPADPNDKAALGLPVSGLAMPSRCENV